MQRFSRTLLSTRDKSLSTQPHHVSAHRFELIGAALLLVCAVTAVHFASSIGDSAGSGEMTAAHTGPQSTITLTQMSPSPSASPSVTPATSTPAVGTTPNAVVTSPGGGQPDATATPPPTITPSPTPSPTPIPLVVTFTCATMSIANGGDVCIHTQPGASFELTASYCNTQDGGNDYIYDVADDQGNYEWTWDLDTTCTPTPTATISVIVYLGHQVVPNSEEVPVS